MPIRVLNTLMRTPVTLAGMAILKKVYGVGPATWELHILYDCALEPFAQLFNTEHAARATLMIWYPNVRWVAPKYFSIQKSIRYATLPR